jgi:hypothetical protein
MKPHNDVFTYDVSAMGRDGQAVCLERNVDRDGFDSGDLHGRKVFRQIGGLLLTGFFMNLSNLCQYFI